MIFVFVLKISYYWCVECEVLNVVIFLILYQTSNGCFDIFNMHCEENTTLIMDLCSGELNLNSNSTMCHGQNCKFVLYHSPNFHFFEILMYHVEDDSDSVTRGGSVELYAGISLATLLLFIILISFIILVVVSVKKNRSKQMFQAVLFYTASRIHLVYSFN